MTKKAVKPKAKPKPKRRIVRAKGRPTKFTPDVRTRIIAAIRNGNTYEASANYGGICYSLLREWIVRGEQEESGDFLEFVDAVKKAEAEAEVESVALIRRSAQEGQWQAAAWFLERRKPSDWGRRDRHEVNHTGSVNVEELTDEQLAARKAELLAKLNQG